MTQGRHHKTMRNHLAAHSLTTPPPSLSCSMFSKMAQEPCLQATRECLCQVCMLAAAEWKHASLNGCRGSLSGSWCPCCLQVVPRHICGVCLHGTELIACLVLLGCLLLTAPSVGAPALQRAQYLCCITLRWHQRLAHPQQTCQAQPLWQHR